MKLFFLFLTTSVLCLCKTKQTSNTVDSTRPGKNDTVCYQPFFSSNKIDLLKACHVIFSDSADKEMQSKYSQGKLSSSYNFDNQSQDFSYTRRGDSIIVRLLFLVKKRDEIKPDKVIASGDTLRLKEIWQQTNSTVSLDAFPFEEFYYVFRVKGNDFIPIIRHWNH
jgi:hypothetical protein